MSVSRGPILVINAGSSSVKFSLFDIAADRTLAAGAHGEIEGIGHAARLKISGADGTELVDRSVSRNDHAGAIAAIQGWFTSYGGDEAQFSGIGHRLVHGGMKYVAPVVIDAAVLAELQQLIPLAPLHQPQQIDAIRAVAIAAPAVPQVACFDTAFHSSQSPLSQHYALPRALTAQGIRRYGFHGLSYEYIVSILPQIAPNCATGKLVVAHLGNGASMCAIEQGRSVATTMGLTPVDGLPMGTRSGVLDPGVLLYLLQHQHLDAAAIQDLIYERSGLLGVSGLSSDMRILLASELPSAKEAVDLFVYRVGRELGSLTAALGGLDALIFTGGIGEHAPQIRARVCNDARWLGISLDEQANANGSARISTPAATPSAWVIPTDENLMVARHTQRLLAD